MKHYLTSYAAAMLPLLLQGNIAIAQPQSLSSLHIEYKDDNTLTISNHSNQTFNLMNASIEFEYSGKVKSILRMDQHLAIPFVTQHNKKNKLYTATLSRHNYDLLPNKTFTIILNTDKKSLPRNINLHFAPTPVNVTTKVSNAKAITTISICNTSGQAIPLHNLELDFTYTSPMPTNIWGDPWANWTLASQTNNQVVLIGGTADVPDLPSDPGCMWPMTIQFNAAASIALPTGPFVFKAENIPPPPPANVCTFDNTKHCALYKDILNDISPEGLRYYGPTNYDHRISGEIEVFDSTLVTPYTDSVNAPGQLKLTAKLMNGQFKSGEIMTRPNLNLPPYNAPAAIHPFTTNDIPHGYIEARVRLPRCEVSTDNLCQTNTAPNSYNNGMWPSVWLLPTMDTNWPQNGEIDIFEAYKHDSPTPYTEATATLHFNGNDPRCGNGDCKFIGYHLPSAFTSKPLWSDFHTWGFEWEPDPNSADGGVILTGYFDNVKLWGPLTTDSLPADGPNAFSRGFHDPNGGFYFITALALGGGYAGAPDPHLLSASMYIQSVKTYVVDGIVPPPVKDYGTLEVDIAAASDPQCTGGQDTFFVDQSTTGQAFTVIPNTSASQQVLVGSHQVRLTSQISIPAPNNLPGVCKSTLDTTQVQIQKNVVSHVTATYHYQPNSNTAFAYNLVLGSPFLPVIVNGTIKCPGSDGKSTCLISNQMVKSTMTIKGTGTDFCNLIVQSTGALVIGPNSSRCFVVTSPATPTTPGRVNLPGGF